MTVRTRVHASENQQRSSTAESADHPVDGVDNVANEAFARAIGEELRRAREARGWSRVQMSARMPSGNRARTVLAFEHGARQLTLLKLIEFSRVLRVDPAVVVARGLARAGLYLENLTLHVDLNALLDDSGRGGTFGPIRQWARNTLNEHPDGIAEIEPAVVRNLALFIGCSHQGLATHLARFTPEVETHDEHPAHQHERRKPQG